MAQPREAAAAGQGGMLGSGALEQPGPDIEHTHTLRGTRARGAEAAADIGGADKAHLSDNDFVSGYFCAAGTSGCSQRLASWGESSSFAWSGMETQLSSPPRSLGLSSRWQNLSWAGQDSTK